MIVKWGIRDGLAFVHFDDEKGGKHLLTSLCDTNPMSTLAYGLPKKKYFWTEFSNEIRTIKSTPVSFKKTWNSLVDGGSFQKTKIDSVGDDLKEVIGV
jgi:hypothetical protein